MKKIYPIVFLFAVLAKNMNGQQYAIIKEDYLRKSRNQKAAAWVLFGSGIAAAVAGLTIGGKKEADLDKAATGIIIAGAGGLFVIGSLPLFAASARNKKKALALSLKNERIIQYSNGYAVRGLYPALSLKITLF